MIKKSFLVSFIFVLATFVSLLSQIVITRIFGATFELDVFLAAVALPTIIVTVIYGTLNDALLPLLGETKNKNPQRFNLIFTSTLFYLTLIVFIISLLVFIFSSHISAILYRSRGEMFIDAVSTQMKLMTLSFPLSIITTFFGSYYYLHKNLIKFPLAQLIGSVTNVIVILLFVTQLGIWSLVFGFTLNIVVQIFFVLPPREIFTKIDFKIDNNIKKLLVAWLPLLIGYFALKNDTLLIRSFGAALPEGSLVQLNLIFRIFSLATSIMTIGFQIVLLPQLIEDFSKKNNEKAISDVRNFKIITILISLAITFFTVLLTPVVINLLFVGGKFTSLDASRSLAYVPYFILPAIAWGINNIFFQPLIALKKQKELGILNTAAFVLAWVVGSTFIKILPPPHAITASLLTLLFTGIIGSEILWQKEKVKLLIRKSQSA